ncbi:MAG TPA: putative Ig domain-containing protein [Blastocatellia bacterium]
MSTNSMNSRRIIIGLLATALILLGSLSSEAMLQGSPTTTVTTCGDVSAYTAAGSTTQGSITIGGQTFAIDEGTTITGSQLIIVGSSLCIQATLDASGNITVPTQVKADVETSMTLCGSVTTYAAATSTTPGSITIGGTTYIIAAGATIASGTTITTGSSICIQATLDPFGNIIIGQVESSLTICGAISAYTAASATGVGSITIAGQTLQIAPGTTFNNENLVAVGSTVCLSVTLNSNGQIFGTPTATLTQEPVLNLPGPETVTAGSTLSFTVTATDANMGATVTLSTTGTLPEGASFNPTTGGFTFTPNSAETGQTFTVNFTATDNLGGSTTGSVIIKVLGASEIAPAIAFISLPSPVVVAVGSTVAFNVIAVSQSGTQIPLTAIDLPAGASFNTSTGTFTFTPTSTEAGQTFTVSFEETGSTTQMPNGSIQIQVVSASGAATTAPPAISAPQGPIVLTAGTSYQIPVSAVSSTPNCTVSLASTDLPTGATLNSTTGLLTFTPSTTQAGLTFFVNLTATDCNGRSSSMIIPFLILPATGPGTIGTIEVPVTKIIFTPTVIGETSGSVTVTVFNLGTGTLTLNSATLTSGTDFHITGPSGAFGLQPGGTAEFTITFQPTHKGESTDTLTISSSDPANGSVTIGLKGDGLKNKTTTTTSSQ